MANEESGEKPLAAGAANLEWTVTERGPRADYVIFDVYRQRARHPVTGREKPFSIIETRDWVNIIALTPTDDVVMVRQFRHATREVTLEIPGGVVEVDEDPLDAARRELREETGYGADAWRYLGFVEPNPAIQTNRCDLFLAVDAEPRHALEPDEGEVIEVVRHPLATVRGLLSDGTITHALVVAAFAHLLLAAGGWRRPIGDLSGGGG